MTGYLRRALMPRLVVALANARAPARLRAKLRRALGRPARVELYFAFDDPYAALALPALAAVAQRHGARLALFPVVARGIEGDPAAALRPAHAVADSARLARRDGRELTRRTPLAAADTEFLALWTEAARRSTGMAAFASAALARLWLRGDGPVRASDYVSLFERYVSRPPPLDEAPLRARLAANRRRLLRKGHWESPAARVDGEWFFAHERLAQIDARLAELAGAGA